MTDREKILDQLSAYLDGELGQTEARKIERLLADDAELAGELRKLQAVRDMVAGLPREQAGEDFVSMVMAQVERRDLIGSAGQEDADKPLRWVRWLASAAVLLVAVGIGVVMTALFNPSTWTDNVAETERPRATGQIARTSDDLTEEKISAKPGTAGGSTGKLRAGAAGLELKAEKATPAEQPPLPRDGSTGLTVASAVRHGNAPSKLEPQPPVRALARSARLPVVAKGPPVVAPKRPAAPAAPARQDVPVKKADITDAGRSKQADKATVPAAKPEPLAVADAVKPAEAVTVADLSAKPAAAEADSVADVIANARREVLSADSLEELQRRVEGILEANHVVKLAAGPPVESKPELVRRQRATPLSNYVQLPSPGPRQVQYLVQVSASQMTQVVSRLESIRRGKHVPTAGKETAATRPAKPAGKNAWIAIEEVDGRLRLKPEVTEAVSKAKAPADSPALGSKSLGLGVLAAGEKPRLFSHGRRRPEHAEMGLVSPDEKAAYAHPAATRPVAAGYQYLLITLQTRPKGQAPAGK